MKTKAIIAVLVVILGVMIVVPAANATTYCATCGLECIFFTSECAGYSIGTYNASYQHGVYECTIDVVRTYRSRLYFYHIDPDVPVHSRIMLSHTHDEYHVPWYGQYGCGTYGWDSSSFCNAYD